MLESAWLFIGALGVGCTATTLWTDDDETGMIVGALGFVTWGVWCFNALNVEVAEGGTVFQFSMPYVVLIGLCWAAPCLFVLLTGPIDAVGKSEETREEGNIREL
jgi:hypothetical protein